MSNVIQLMQPSDDKYEVQYVMDDERGIVGVTHPKWGFRIMRNENEIAIVCKDTDEPFGILPADVFNTLLICWLLIDDPKLIDDAASHE